MNILHIANLNGTLSYYTSNGMACITLLNHIRQQLIDIYARCLSHSSACEKCELKFVNMCEISLIKCILLNSNINVDEIKYNVYTKTLLNRAGKNINSDDDSANLILQNLYDELYLKYSQGLVHLLYPAQNNYKSISNVVHASSGENDVFPQIQCKQVLPEIKQLENKDITIEQNKQEVFEFKPIQNSQQLAIDLINQNELNQKIKDINDYKLLCQFNYEKRKEEFDEERRKLELELNTFINKKTKLTMEKDKKKQHERMFMEGKKTYCLIKKDLLDEKILEIPEMFKQKYKIYQELDEKCILGTDNEYKQYLELERECKLQQFINDKQKYLKLKDDIDTGIINLEDIDVEFRAIYEVFDIMLSEYSELTTLEQYDMFIYLYNEYLEINNLAKYGLDDISYLQDSSAGPVIKVVVKEHKPENELDRSSIVKTLNL